MGPFNPGCGCCGACCEGVELEAFFELLTGEATLPDIGAPNHLPLTLSLSSGRQNWRYFVPFVDPEFDFIISNNAPQKFACEWNTGLRIKDSTQAHPDIATTGQTWKHHTCNPFHYEAILPMYGSDLDGDGLGDVAAVIKVTVSEVP